MGLQTTEIDLLILRGCNEGKDTLQLALLEGGERPHVLEEEAEGGAAQQQLVAVGRVKLEGGDVTYQRCIHTS